MALTDIKPSYTERIERFVLRYHWRDDPGAGFAFSCDAQGNRMPNPGADSNYERATTEAVKPNGEIVYIGMEDESFDDRVPAQGKCPCGRIVWLAGDYGHGISCDCGRIYNMSGQELAPRSQWEDHWDEDSTEPYNVEFGYVGVGDDY